MMLIVYDKDRDIVEKEMKNYTSYFIGVPLPQKFQQEFEMLLEDVSNIDSNLEVVDSGTPHITIYYLDKQSQDDLPEIAKNVKSIKSMIHSTELKVGGLDFFGGEDPRVLFLKVFTPEVLKDFNQSLTDSLKDYCSNDNSWSFHPHMTVARVRTPEAKKSFKKSRPDLKSRFEKVNWIFPITELVLYGVDSTKHPERHYKLITIPCK